MDEEHNERASGAREEPEATRAARRRKPGPEEGPTGHVREDDILPYTGLRWVGTVFKAAAIFLLVALVGEYVAGLRTEGLIGLPNLLGETARTFVIMVVLWGAGDLIRLVVDIGHDIRAQRVFLTRIERRSRASGAPRAFTEMTDERVAMREEAASGGQSAGAAGPAPGGSGSAPAGARPGTGSKPRSLPGPSTPRSPDA